MFTANNAIIATINPIVRVSAGVFAIVAALFVGPNLTCNQGTYTHVHDVSNIHIEGVHLHVDVRPARD